MSCLHLLLNTDNKNRQITEHIIFHSPNILGNQTKAVKRRSEFRNQTIQSQRQKETAKNKGRRQRNRRLILLVKIAFQSAVPFGGGSRNGEPGEELGERTRWRRPVNFTKRVDKIFCCYVSPIHRLITTIVIIIIIFRSSETLENDLFCAK